MIKVPHIIEVDWDMEDVEIDDVIDIETLSEDEPPALSWITSES